MPSDRQFEYIFAECLDRLQGGEDLEMILRDHPDEADRIRPLLESTNAIAAFSPDPEPRFKTAARLRFHGAVRGHVLREQEKAESRWFSGGLTPLARAWVGSAAVLVLALGISGGATVASASAMPESPLYGIKRLAERARLAMTPSEARRSDLLLTFADERARELTVMAAEGRVDQVERLQRDLVKQMELAQAERGVSSTVLPSDSVAEVSAAAPPMMAAAPMAGADSESIMSTSADVAEGAQGSADAAASSVRMGPEPNEELRALLARFQHEYEEHFARLTLAQQNAPPSARDVVSAALEEIRARYLAVSAESGVDDLDSLERIVLLQGVAAIRDGTLFIGGRPVTFVESRAPRAGDFIVISGIPSADGSIRVIEVQRTGQQAPSRDYVAIQAPLVQVGEDTITVGDYTVVLPKNTSLRPEVRLGMWLEVRGNVDDYGSLIADSVYAIGGYPRPFGNEK